MSDAEIIKQLATNLHSAKAIEEYRKAHPGTSEEYAKWRLSELVAQSSKFTRMQKFALMRNGLKPKHKKDTKCTPDQVLTALMLLFFIGIGVVIFVKLGIFGGIIAILCIPSGGMMLADAFHQGFRGNKR